MDTELRKELAEWCSKLSALLESGVFINKALEQLAVEVRHPRLRQATGHLRLRVEDGESITTALRIFSDVFDRRLITLIDCGEPCGIVPSVLKIAPEYICSDSVKYGD